VLWVSRAKAEHDMFRNVMQERGVEVFEAETLLAEALARPEAKDWVCGAAANRPELWRPGPGESPVQRRLW
jgi:arginine deiminase